MDINNASVGTVFFTFYAYMDHNTPRFSVTKWSLVSVEHRVAMMVIGGTTYPSSVRVIDQKEKCFATEADAWGACAESLSALAESIYKSAEECRKKQADSFEDALDNWRDSSAA